METWGKVIIEMLVLIFFAGIYYLFQRRRILRADLGFIFHSLNKLIEEIKSDLLPSLTDEYDLEIVKSFMEELEKNIQEQDILSLKETLSKTPTIINEMQQDQIRFLLTQIEFHTKKLS